jgi:succinoglycan biosynthesis transport protein ExoP
MSTPAVISRSAPRSSLPPANGLSWRVLLAGLRRGWRWCVALPLAAMLLAAMASPLLPNWYQASVILQVRDGDNSAAPTGSPAAAAATLATAALAASPQVVAPVVTQLRLQQSAEFAPRHWRPGLVAARLGARWRMAWRGGVQDAGFFTLLLRRAASRKGSGPGRGARSGPGRPLLVRAAAARLDRRRGGASPAGPSAAPAARSIPPRWAGNQPSGLALAPLAPLWLAALPTATPPPLPRAGTAGPLIAADPSRAAGAASRGGARAPFVPAAAREPNGAGMFPPSRVLSGPPHASDPPADPPSGLANDGSREASRGLSRHHSRGASYHPSSAPLRADGEPRAIPLPRRAAASPPAPPGAKLAGIAARLLSRLQVQPETHGDLLTLTYRDHDPRLAAAIANAISAELQAQVQAGTGLRLQHRAAALAAALHGVKGQWQAASQALMAFRAAHAADALPPGAGQSAAMARLMALSQALTRAEIDLWRQQALVSAGRGQPGQPPAQANSGAQARLADLWLQRAELAAQESRLAAQYGPSALPLVQARRALASIQASLVRYRRALLSGHRVSARADRRERARLQTAVAREGALLAVAERNAAQDAMLAAQVHMRRDLYQRLWQRQRGLWLRRTAQPPALQILAPAVLPRRPAREPWRVALAAAAVFGLLAGAAIAVGGDLVDPRLYEENAAALGVPRLGALPRREGPGWERALDELWVTWAMAAPAETTFLFTSALPGEGKTTAAAALAQRLAAAGHSVLVVDCHFSSPQLTVAWAARPFPGLAEYLSGRCSLEALFAAILRSGAPAREPLPATSPQPIAMAVLPTGAWRPELAGALAGPALRRLLAEATKRFDWVFLDAGAVTSQSEMRLLAHACDATVLVAAMGATRFATALAAVRTLRAGAAKKLALILNSGPTGHAALPAQPTATPAADAVSAAAGAR